jgi:hypothetical protein
LIIRAGLAGCNGSFFAGGADAFEQDVGRFVVRVLRDELAFEGAL